jgi:rhodanese-related sulfurtransferase
MTPRGASNDPRTEAASKGAGRAPRRLLAVTAAALGIMAAFAGDPRPSADAAGRETNVDIAALATEIASEKDHVTALELAEWIRDQKSGLRVIDVRSPEELDDGRIPTAETVDLAALTRTAFGASDTIVVYSAESVHAAQAWVLLRTLGHRTVFFLRGGSTAWHDEVMHPTLEEEGASPEAETAFARASAVSRYFGGMPHVVPREATKSTDPVKTPSGAPARPGPRHRRGC